MSQALYNEIVMVKQALADVEASVAVATKDQALIRELIESNKQLRKEVEALAASVRSFDAMKDAIAKDARDVLGEIRHPLDPTKAKLPPTLKALGYGAPKK